MRATNAMNEWLRALPGPDGQRPPGRLCSIKLTDECNVQQHTNMIRLMQNGTSNNMTQPQGMNTIYHARCVTFSHFGVRPLNAAMLFRGVITVTFNTPELRTVTGNRPWLL